MWGQIRSTWGLFTSSEAQPSPRWQRIFTLRTDVIPSCRMPRMLGGWKKLWHGKVMRAARCHRCKSCVCLPPPDQRRERMAGSEGRTWNLEESLQECLRWVVELVQLVCDIQLTVYMTFTHIRFGSLCMFTKRKGWTTFAYSEQIPWSAIRSNCLSL